MKHLSRFAVLAGCCAALALIGLAEDFWVKKAYKDWSDKDAAKLLENSPWSRQVSVGLGGPQSMDAGGGGRGRGRGGGGGGDMGGMSDASRGEMGGPDMNGSSSRGRGGSGGMESMGGSQSMLLTVRWQSALPIREALVVTKLGHEKVDSEQANNFLKQEIHGYVIAVAGLPAGMARMSAERLNEIAKTAAALRIKEKDPIAAERAEAVARDRFVDVYFVFPKTQPITLEDKEVEFAVNLGRIEVKRKFKLKEMVFGDKLEL